MCLVRKVHHSVHTKIPLTQTEQLKMDFTELSLRLIGSLASSSLKIPSSPETLCSLPLLKSFQSEWHTIVSK